MKSGNKAYLIAFLSIFSFCIQAAEVKFPSLAELAAKKSAESLEIDSPQYEKLTLDTKEKILTSRGTLSQILNFVKNNPQATSSELISSIPPRFWESLLNNDITIQIFADKVKEFSLSEQKWLNNALYAKILQLLHPEEIVTYRLIKRSLGSRGEEEYRLPIAFKTKIDTASNKSLLYLNIPILFQFDYLLSLYIYKNLEKQILDKIVIEYKRPSYHVPYYGSLLMGIQDVPYLEDVQTADFDKWKSIFEQLIIFADQTPQLKKYILPLNAIFHNLVGQRFHNAYGWKFKLDPETNELVGQ